MSNCSDCKNNGTQICSVCCSYQGCPDRWEAKPKTNADRFRAMSDEELAEWFWKNDWIYLKTKREMLEWLKQEEQ